MSYRERNSCRLCGSEKLETVLELNDTPLANEFVGEPGEQDTFPLYLAKCLACEHVQLPVVVDPSRLFANYVYVSGTSPSFVNHFHRYADDCIDRLKLDSNSLVVEIGSNDGTMLARFKERGMRVLGIDPARKIAAEATARGIYTMPEFFTTDTAVRIAKDHGLSQLVVANNVFAHADDLHDIATGVREMLSRDGMFVFEVSYLRDVIEKTLFDTIYHEHLSYHSLWPLSEFFDSVGMTLVDAQRVDTHGGSIRGFAMTGTGRTETDRLKLLMREEMSAMSGPVFGSLRKRIAEAKSALLIRLEKRGGTVAGYGAPAKLTTLCHQFGIGKEDVDYVVDDSPWKQGLLTPGTHISVRSASALESLPPSDVIVFAWNFASQIARKHPELAGKFIVPLPTLTEM